MNKSIIYYTDNRLAEPIFSIVQQQILKSRLPIVSVSLQPISFGKNIVLSSKPGYISMLNQIITALQNSDSEYTFFCEHDVLYPLSHFDFTPSQDNIFYYNTNVWRWKYTENWAVTYDRLMSLSGLCVNRLFALNHYQKRWQKIKDARLESNGQREPDWARKWGYEPGTKKIKRGGFSDDDFETWSSTEPIIDIRHGKTFSQSKVTLDSFIHPPQNFRQVSLDQIQGWNLKELFNLSW